MTAAARGRILPKVYDFKEGKLWPNDRPGLGVQVDTKQTDADRQIRHLSRGHVDESAARRFIHQLVGPHDREFRRAAAQTGKRGSMCNPAVSEPPFLLVKPRWPRE